MRLLCVPSFISCVKLDGLEIMEDSELFLNKTAEEADEEQEKIVTLIIEEPKEKWDCESILSEYLMHPPQIREQDYGAALVQT